MKEKVKNNSITAERLKVKKLHKGVTVTIISTICLLFIVIGVGTYLYVNYLNEQQKNTVEEVTAENLYVSYNTDYTNEAVELVLANLSSTDKIVYKFNEDEEYIEYDENLIVDENTIIYIKYMNNYGILSNDDYIIEITNIDKELPIIIQKDIEVTEDSLTITIAVEDNIEVSKVEVSIDKQKYFEVTDNTYTFEELEDETEYTVYIRVNDISGNIVEDEVLGTTTKKEIATVNSNSSTTKNNNSSSSSSGSTSNKTSSSSSSNSTKSSSSSSELTTAQKEAEARKIAKQIAKSVIAKTQNTEDPEWVDLERAYYAAREVRKYYEKCTYTETGSDYYTAYGVFIKGECSCAGTTAALGMILEEMGIKWTWVNKGEWAHQWCTFYCNGISCWADGQLGSAGQFEWGM